MEKAESKPREPIAKPPVGGVPAKDATAAEPAPVAPLHEVRIVGARKPERKRRERDRGRDR